MTDNYVKEEENVFSNNMQFLLENELVAVYFMSCYECYKPWLYTLMQRHS